MGLVYRTDPVIINRGLVKRVSTQIEVIQGRRKVSVVENVEVLCHSTDDGISDYTLIRGENKSHYLLKLLQHYS